MEGGEEGGEGRKEGGRGYILNFKTVKVHSGSLGPLHFAVEQIIHEFKQMNLKWRQWRPGLWSSLTTNTGVLYVGNFEFADTCV